MKENTLKFIREHPECVLATVDRDGRPEAATVLFAIDDSFCFYFGTKKEYRKYRNLTNNDNAAVVVGVNGKDPRTVQAEGKIKILTESADIEKAKETLRTNPAMVPFLELPLVYMQLVPSWLRYLDETKGDIDAFEQIIP